MNIDEILAKHGIISYPNKQYAKQAIKEIVTDVIQMCADNAKIDFENEVIGDIDGVALSAKLPIIDKDSILKTINEINF